MSDSFDDLFEPVQWNTVSARFEQATAPPADLINNVNIVPCIGDQWVVIRLENGDWEIPGGTLEKNESYLDALRRELLEEAGAALVTYWPLGAWKCHSSAAQAFRPHLAHPDFYRFVVCGEVNLVGKPTNPGDGEAVRDVLTLPLARVIEGFRAANRNDLAALYQYAAHVRSQRG